MFSDLFGGYDEDFDILSNIIGGQNRSRLSREKGKTKLMQISVTLEDLYKGKKMRLQLTKNVLCKRCDGRGGKKNAIQICKHCNGEGTTYETHRLSLFRTQKVASSCDKCEGQGTLIDENGKCKDCHGHKIELETKIIEMKIAPGMHDGQKLILYNEGDQKPGIQPGDVVLELRAKEHDVFERRGDDLLIRTKISLNEALCGYSDVLQHLDGRKLLISSRSGHVIKPELMHGIIGEGMPIVGSRKRGNLYIDFDLEFPPNHFTSDDMFKNLETLLGPRKAVKIPEGRKVVEVTLSDYDERRDQNSRGPDETYLSESDDSDDIAGGHRCAQQ
ncbi:dnaJ central domain-containing protein [Ditylenchus destructor]|uniref:DnaJ central domain-containing protein n=1 Tax=Ditylenchus destructor TaxID=166010 RepID=A0AAD4R671_9BILA|nr:dnaJ central domain-containing protein [Ditylenchus destructor]